MKKKIVSIIALAFALVLLFGTAVSAAVPYDTYTYSTDGTPRKSPHAYIPTEQQITRHNISSETVVLDYSGTTQPIYSDFCTDSRGYVYLLDEALNQVVVLNNGYKAEVVIEKFDSDTKRDDTFKTPKGIFVSDTYIYVCDTGNSRILMFDKEGNYCKTVKTNDEDMKPYKGFAFTPISCAADQYGRLFVVSSNSTFGIVVMDDDGTFNGFIGAPKVSYSVFEMFFRRFMSQEERESSLSSVATTFDRVTVDADGFVFAVSSSIDEKKQEEAIQSKSADYSPVRKLNSKGSEIMSRNGFFDCGGEVNVGKATASDDGGVSKIRDVAVGPEGSWSIIDNRRSKVFTYDSNGNLLYAFGDTGNQKGNIKENALTAIDYQYDPQNNTYNLLLLDYSNATITVYSRTEYGDLLIEALHNDNERNYSSSIEYWNRILEANNNFDTAYIGKGKALYNSGDYEGAKEYLQAATETEYYARALAAESQARFADYPILILVVVVVAVLAILALIKVMGYAKRINYEGNFKKTHTYWEELMYSFYVIFHPFDGFWDIKHEKRGTVRGGLTIAGLCVVAFYYQSIGRSYLANPTGETGGFFMQIISVFVPLLLWTVANWCLTTLFEGEAKMKDVFIASCYALSPLPLFLVLSTIYTNLTTTANDSIATLIVTLGYVWVAFLLFFGTLVVQDYSLGKNVVTTLGTIVAMVVIMFVIILFASLVGDMVSFISGIVTEISYR